MRRWLLLDVLLMALFFTSSVVAQDDPCLRLFANAAQQEQQVLPDSSRGSINDVAWSPGGRCFAVASSTGLWLYDVEQPESPVLLSGEGDESVWRIAIKPDGSQFAFSIADNPLVYLLNMDGQVTPIQTRGETVTEVTFAVNANILAIATSYFYYEDAFLTEGGIQLWDLDAGTEIGFVSDITGFVREISFTSDDKHIMIHGARSGYLGDDVEYWNISPLSLDQDWWEVRQEHQTVSTWPLAVTTTAMNGRILALGGLYGYMNLNNWYGSAIEVWDVHEQIPLGEIIVSNNDETADGYDITCLAFTPDVSWLASGNSNGYVLLWNVENGNELAQIQSHDSEISNLVFNPDGDLLAVVGSDRLGRSVRIWNIEGMDEFAVLDGYE